MRHPLLVAAVLATAPACADWGPQYCEGDWAAAPPEAAPSRTQARVVAQVLPVESKAVDILFVIDDSRSMTDEQEQLGRWSAELFDVLSGSGELPDLHIAVTSSSVPIARFTDCVSGGGSLHVGKAVLEKTRYLSDVAGEMGRVRNYTGTLTETFAKMALVGDTGCGFEQPFAAARGALSKYALGGEGFLRDDALLLVVFVTDEDDCSATDPMVFTEEWTDGCSELGALTSYRCFEHGVRCYDGKGSREFGERNNCRPDEQSRYLQSVGAFARFLKHVKRDPAQVVVAGIYGKPNGIVAIPDERFEAYTTPRLANVCGATGVEGTGATPAVRMNALMAEFGGRASHSSICEPELAWAMRDAGLVTRAAATRSRCLRGAISDGDSSVDGVQPTCNVALARDVGTESETHETVPPCGRGDSARCFTVEVDPACPDTRTHLAVRVDERANETVTVTCDVDLDVEDISGTVEAFSDGDGR